MNLLKDDLKKLYLRFLIPSLGSAMVMSIYTLTDAIVIGKGVGADALAALSITTPLLCILMAMGILFGVGGSVQMSVCRGTGNYEKANRFFTLSFFTLTLIAALLWLVYGFHISTLLQIMGANRTLYPYAMAYMKYINMFLPVAVFSNYIAIFVRADGNPNRAMCGVLLGGVVNIVLDIVFVFPLQMGIGGAALASAIGMIVQVLVGLSHFFSRKNGLKFIQPKHILPSILQIISNGVPSFFNEFANGIIVLLFNIQILKYCGDSALSVYSVISNCVILFNSLFTGVGQSIQPIIAFLPMGINLLTSYYLQSVLCVKKSLCISLLRNVILSGAAILTFPLLFGGNSLWLVMPAVELTVLLLSLLLIHRESSSS